MPVIGIPVDMLLERVSSRVGKDELVEHLQHLGCDVEGYARMRRFACRRCSNLMEITETENPPVVCDRCGADYREDASALEEAGWKDVVRMELLAVRPDMFDPGGLARVLRNYFRETLETPSYTLAGPSIAVEVARGMEDRPYIACAVVRNVTLDDDRVRVIMKLQENLHWALGRDRKRASIGVYDLDTLEGTRFRYYGVGREELRFAPLGYPLERHCTPWEILQEHPKGVAYARLISHFERYPLLADEKGRVLALIPIINSEDTKVTKATRNFFIDVTGLEERIVGKTLNTLVTSLAELDRNCVLEQVRIDYPDGRSLSTPDLTPQEMTLDPGLAARYLGVPLDRRGVVECLARMGHRVEDSGDGALRVFAPAYRNDLMHEVDLIEDVAIAYGYHNIVPSLVPTLTVGGELPLERLSNAARACLVGLGAMEVLTLILSNEEQQYDWLNRPRRDDHVLIDNPISVEQTMVRVSLLPGLLDTLSVNTDHELPQKIFEVGNVSCLDPRSQTGAREIRKLAVTGIGPRVDLAALRSVCEAMVREFGKKLYTRPIEDGAFIPGRAASVWADDRDIGVLGEVHPSVLERYKLIYPAAAFELDLERLSS